MFSEMYFIGHCRNRHSNQDTTSSTEAYHGALKRWMLVDNRDKHGRRIDFLVWQLTTPVVSHYMYMQSRKLNGFVLNKSIETTVKNGIARAKMIPVEDIDHPTEVGGVWKVKLQTTPGWWYDVSEPHSIYAGCSCKWSIRGNCCKHQLAILKVSTEFSWSTILEYLGTYYGSLRGGLEALMQHQIVLDPFEDLSNDTSDEDDDNDSGDDPDSGEEHVNNSNDNMENVDNSDTNHAGSQPLYKEPRSCMEGKKSSIKKLMEDTLEDAIGGGIEVLHHLHSIMLTVAKDIRRIRVQKETNTLHPQVVFSIIDNRDGNSILHKKVWIERMMGSQKRKRPSCTRK